MASKKLPLIPPHLAAYPWYAPHQAWLEVVARRRTHAAPRGTVAKQADLSGEDLSFADLSYADLTEANFSGANLVGVNFSFASLLYVNFADADLAGVTWTGARGLDRFANGARLSQLLSGAWVYVPGPP